MSDNENLHLVIVEGSRKRANSCVAMLEAAGYDVQLVQVQDTRALEAMSDQPLADIVLYGEGARIPEIEAVAACLAEHAVDIPLVALASDRTSPDSMPSGTSAVVSLDRPDELVSTIRMLLGDAALGRRICRLEEAVGTIQLQQRIDQLEKALQEKEKDCLTLVDNSRDAIAYVFNGDYLYANPACLAYYGMEELAELQGTPLLERVDADDHAVLEELLHNCHQAGDAMAVKIRLTDNQGRSRSTAVAFAPASFENRRCTRMTIRAPRKATVAGMITEASTQEQLFSAAFNRQYFMQAVEDSLKFQDRTGMFQTVTYVLLDDFRTIRENFGIYAGDQAIKNISALIQDNYGEEDTVSQFGDYVFAILSSSQDEDHAYLLADSLRKKVKKHVTVVGGQIVQTTCSIGMCVINEHMKNSQDVLSRADLACEVARSSGGNLVHVHSTAIDAQIGSEVELQCDSMIRKTIDDERLYLVYQPIVSLNSKAGGCYEVLLRVVDENGHVMLPGQFVSLAGKTGMSTEIDRWVIGSALKSLHDNRDEDDNIVFFVKVSSSTLSDGKFPAWLEKQLKKNKLQGSSLILEIPEANAVRNTDVTSGFINAVHKIGCQIAIEHFGYTSPPELLLDLAMDYLKIDGSLVDNLAYSSENQARVRSVVDFARTTKTQCIAERVDDASSLVTLWQYDVDYIQGNFVREPGREANYDFEDAIALHNLAEA